MEHLENFSKVKILVVGDIMLDRYWWGSVNRISPEAPVPVVHLRETSMVAGGAANVAVNIAGLNAEPFLVGMLGDDEEGKLLPSLLNNSNISANYLIKLPTRQTITKTRIIAHSQQIVRVDQESKLNLTDLEEEAVWQIIEKLIEKINLIIVSDYNKGFLTDNLIKRLITKARSSNKSVLVDPKGKNFDKYRGATILTPNLKEIIEACAMDETSMGILESAGRQLIETLGLSALLVTQGEAGMTLLEKGKKSFSLTARARKVYDVTGAGDTVIATLGVALGAGFNLKEASDIANVAAGLVVEKVGTAAIKFDELKNSMA